MNRLTRLERDLAQWFDPRARKPKPRKVVKADAEMQAKIDKIRAELAKRGKA